MQAASHYFFSSARGRVHTAVLSRYSQREAAFEDASSTQLHALLILYMRPDDDDRLSQGLFKSRLMRRLTLLLPARCALRYHEHRNIYVCSPNRLVFRWYALKFVDFISFRFFFSSFDFTFKIVVSIVFNRKLYKNSLARWLFYAKSLKTIRILRDFFFFYRKTDNWQLKVYRNALWNKCASV